MRTCYPEITQQEFCDHIEDDDFFLVYGNPVVIRADSGAKLLAIAFPLYERQMRLIGRGDKIEAIKRECAEAYRKSMAFSEAEDHALDDPAEPHYSLILPDGQVGQ